MGPSGAVHPEASGAGSPSGAARPGGADILAPMTPDLAAILARCWDELASGAADRRHGFHVGALATVAPDGTPRVRSLVLRAVDAAHGEIRSHTDLRSPKVAELARAPRVAWHFYAPERAMQLRLLGSARIESAGAAADDAWEASALTSRRCYLAPAAPGAPCDEPSPNLPVEVRDRRPTESETLPGRSNFAILRTEIDAIDWLSLASEGHRRASFARRDGGWTASWREP
ncbi:MAG: hypothetical protein RI967_1530 [Planctomycetota bacterium]